MGMFVLIVSMKLEVGVVVNVAVVVSVVCFVLSHWHRSLYLSMLQRIRIIHRARSRSRVRSMSAAIGTTIGSDHRGGCEDGE